MAKKNRFLYLWVLQGSLHQMVRALPELRGMGLYRR